MEPNVASTPETTIVHLVRHGEVHNPERVLYGRLPGYHLSERGRAQAAATAASFASHDVTQLYSSPLQRTRETSEPFQQVTGRELQTNEGLLEAGNRFEGLRIKSWRSQLWNPVRWPLLVDPRVPSWGEPYEHIAERMMDTIADIRERAAGHEAIVISHQLPIVCVQRHLQGLPLYHNPALRRCDLASVTSLIFHGEDIMDMHYTEPARDLS
ncbi:MULTISPECIES: histidine phosphatase family protein [unclassified Corynebacterium]|uniref:histidine phosphatase family protein n=1 Tax=Corynebacterium TaxID=1716 RepID=UPI00124BEF3C